MTYTDKTNKFMRSLDIPEVYLVGGAVRNRKLGLRIKDADYIVRGIDQRELKQRVRKAGAVPTDLKLRDGRVVGVRANPKGLGLIEITLPRMEKKLPFDRPMDKGNMRHAVEIEVNPNITLEQDALRRDLTINALYENIETGEVVDPTGGLGDLEDLMLRTTHETSYTEDPLRILRTLRFLSVLDDFQIATATRAQMKEQASAVTGLTGKGVSGTALEELTKIIMGRNVAKALREAVDTGVLAAFLPELAPMIGFEQESAYHDMTVDMHTFKALDWAAAANMPLRVRLALLFHDAGKPESAWRGEDGKLHYYATTLKVKVPTGCDEEREVEVATEDHAVISARLARKALKRLNAESKLIRDVPILIERHMVPLTMKVKPTKVRKWRAELGDDMLADLFKHRLADCMGKAALDYEAFTALARMEKIREDAQDAGVPASPKNLKDKGLIDGHDLIAMGVSGDDIGRILNTLLHEVISQPDRADREWLLSRAKKLAGAAA